MTQEELDNLDVMKMADHVKNPDKNPLYPSKVYDFCIESDGKCARCKLFSGIDSKDWKKACAVSLHNDIPTWRIVEILLSSGLAKPKNEMDIRIPGL